MPILTCPKCKPHPYQDARYGNQKRVMNPILTPPGMPKKYRCTICGAEVTDKP